MFPPSIITPKAEYHTAKTARSRGKDKGTKLVNTRKKTRTTSVMVRDELICFIIARDVDTLRLHAGSFVMIFNFEILRKKKYVGKLDSV